MAQSAVAILQQAAQAEAATGRKLDQRTLEAMLRAAQRADYEQSVVAAQYGLQKRASDRADEQVEAQEKSSAISGITGVVGTGAQLYLTNKYISALKPAPTPPSVGLSATGGTPGTVAAGTQAAMSGLPSATGVAGGVPGSAAATEAALNMPTAITSSQGALSTALPYAGAAGAGYAGGALGEWVAGTNKPGNMGGERQTAGIAGGAALGAAYGSMFLPGPGTAIGAIIGAAAGYAESKSVVCTALYEKGYIPFNILCLDSAYRKRCIPDDVYAGYLRLATPIVRLMERSKMMTAIVRPFGVAWAYEMASRMEPGIKGRLLGKAILKIGVPLCRAYQRLTAKLEVSYGK